MPDKNALRISPKRGAPFFITLARGGLLRIRHGEVQAFRVPHLGRP